MDWLRKVPIGQYVAGENSWLRWIDPRIKFGWVLFFLVTPVLATSEWRVGLVLSLLGLTLCSRLPARVWWRSLSFLLIFSFFIGVFAMLLPASEQAATHTVRNPLELVNSIAIGPSWYLFKFGPIQFFNTSLGPFLIDRRSLELGINSATLVFTVVHSVNLMLITSLPEDLVWALRWFLSPFSLLGFSTDKISFQLLLALRFIPLIQEELQNLLQSLATRAVSFKRLGFKASFGLILSVGERLLANILLRSQQGADALVARNGSWQQLIYLKPSPAISRFSKMNLGAVLFLIMGLILRFFFGR
tara:strand:+ start:4767 stop:5675 length:909 start_codon:yes stop_codon:yes gene_type:complete